jgi:hypothetical protein
MDNLKNDLEEIFEILYEQNKLKLAELIQRMYFILEEAYDDDDFEYESETESDEYYDNYVETDEELEIQVDDNGFLALR